MIDTIDLSFVADALLGLCGPDPLAPYYTEDAWSTRSRRAERREVPLSAHPTFDLAAKVQDALLADEVRDVVDGAGLTEAQGEVFALRMLGHTFEEIGRARRTSKQAAMNAFAHGLRKVSASLANYPRRGLSDAYGADVARRGHRRRSR